MWYYPNIYMSINNFVFFSRSSQYFIFSLKLRILEYLLELMFHRKFPRSMVRSPFSISWVQAQLFLISRKDSWVMVLNISSVSLFYFLIQAPQLYDHWTSLTTFHFNTFSLPFFFASSLFQLHSVIYLPALL